jgi:hypothetical protein
VALEKDREDQLDRSCEERTSITRDILHTINRKKTNWIGHILGKTCLLKHVIEVEIDRRIEVTVTRERSKQLLHDLEETRGYWKLKEEALDRTLWRTGCGRGYWACLKTENEMNALCHVCHLFICKIRSF